MEMADVLSRNRAVVVSALACLLLMRGSLSAGQVPPSELPGDFEVSRYFSWFGGSGDLDWRALRDPNNNPILIACLQGDRRSVV